MTERVTIAIPFYRGPDYLRTAIESVLAQDDEGWHLLISDDGERDEASDVLDSLGLVDAPQVQCLRNAVNLGMVLNWNQCLDSVETPLACLMHADDVLEPGYVRTMRRMADAHPSASAFFCDARIIDGQGRGKFSFADWIKRFYLPPGAKRAAEFSLQGSDALRAIMAGNFIMCPTLCYRMAALAGRRFDPRYQQVQDLAFTARLLMDGDELIGSHERVYAYRRHAGAATSRQSESLLRFREEFALFDEVAARSDELGWERASRVARRKLVVRLHLAYRALGDLLRLRIRPAAKALRMVGGERGRRS